MKKFLILILFACSFSAHAQTTISHSQTQQTTTTKKKTKTKRTTTPNKKTADSKKTADNKKTAQLNVYSSYPEAYIYVDDSYKGKGSWKGELIPGDHIAEVRMGGYYPVKRFVTLKAGDNINVSITPSKSKPTTSRNIATTNNQTTARLNVYSSFPEACIYIDNSYKGTSTWKGELKPGSYTIEARLDGYYTEKKYVTLKAGDNINVNITPSRQNQQRLRTEQLTIISQQ